MAYSLAFKIHFLAPSSNIYNSLSVSRLDYDNTDNSHIPVLTGNPGIFP